MMNDEKKKKKGLNDRLDGDNNGKGEEEGGDQDKGGKKGGWSACERDLENLHGEFVKVRDDYFQERKSLERKYNELYSKIFEKRCSVINFQDWTTDDVEGFWITAMMSNGIIRKNISVHDKMALCYLQDIRSVDVDGVGLKQYGFRLEFHFKKNPYFVNGILQKTYRVPNFYGNNVPLLESVEGCDIEWISDKTNLNKIHHENGENSFFSFFEAPWLPGPLVALADVRDLETERILEDDYSVGLEFHKKLIPEAVKWFTAEAAYNEGHVSEESIEEDGEEQEVDWEDSLESFRKEKEHESRKECPIQ